jgi:WD40 repeat protein
MVTGSSLRGIVLSEPKAAHTGGVSSLGWARDGDRLLLATGSYDGGVRLWKTTESDALAPLRLPHTAHTGGVLCMEWAPDGDRLLLATGGSDESVRLWEVVDSDTLTARGAAHTGHTDGVLSAGWARDGDRLLLATGGYDGTVRLWELTGPDGLASLGSPLSHEGAVSSLGWARDGDRLLLATGGYDGTLRLWELTGPDGLASLGSPLSHEGAVSSLAWARHDERLLLAVGTRKEVVRLWEMTTPETLTPLGLPHDTGAGELFSLRWVRAGNRPLLAGAGYGKAVHLWEATGSGTLTPLSLVLTHPAPVLTLGWSWDGDRCLLATGSDDGTLRLWEVAEERPVARLPRYRSDTLDELDDLARTEEARALAELITARTARPPLAVGIFGDWGEGKSHFLRLLHHQVDTLAIAENPQAHHAVRQVRFNAWHYAEAGLWASLVAELFAQLSTPAKGSDPGKTQRSMSRLTAELVAERQMHQRLAAARARHDSLKKALERNVIRRVLAVLRVKSSNLDRRKTALSLALCVLLGVVVTGSALRWPEWWARVLSVVVAVSAVGSVWLRDKKKHKVLQNLWKAFKKSREQAAAQRGRLQTAVDVSAAEVTALEREIQDLTAAGQLAGLISDRATTTDYRNRLGVMTQIRADFQRMAELLAQTARETDADPPGEHDGDGPAEGGSGTADAAGDQLPRIERIVVYVDDLDRCPPARVVEMLEAIHLLLAVELFVVVVAIDPRWLLRSVAAHYREVLGDFSGAGTGGSEGHGPDDEDLWMSTPSQYLEKIFQVVLTLPSLETEGYQRMLRSLVGVQPDQDTAVPASSAPTASPDGRPAADPGSGAPVRHEDEADLYGPVGILRVVERTDPLTLDPDEISLLGILGPPLMVTTPRSVKRLANSYGLLTALRRAQRERDLAETPGMEAGEGNQSTPYRPYRAGMVLLAAMVAYPALGPALGQYLHRRAGEHPEHAWADFCDELEPREEGGHWRNSADRDLTSTQVRQWEGLRRALRHVTEAAAAHGLHLPAHLGPWREWVLPVARLSFPAGRIVSTLQQQDRGRVL